MLGWYAIIVVSPGQMMGLFKNVKIYKSDFVVLKMRRVSFNYIKSEEKFICINLAIGNVMKCVYSISYLLSLYNMPIGNGATYKTLESRKYGKVFLF